MKNVLAVVAVAGMVLGSTPANASVQRSVELIERGNAAMTIATQTVKSTGSTKASCPYLKTAADSYASAYVLYQDQRTLALMQDAHNSHQKHC